MADNNLLWTKEQLILALNLYWRTPYNKISGTSNDDIKKLALVIGKSPAAISFILMNFTSLDSERQEKGEKGKRKPGELGVRVWNEYFNQWDKLTNDSYAILNKLNPDRVLDFFDYKSNEGIEKERTIMERVNQSDFRQRILASYNRCCCITGIDIPSLLVASHIVPWKKNLTEALNPRNGLCLNQIHDKAFDIGLITITTDFRIKLSDYIVKRKKDQNIQKFFIAYENQLITKPERFHPSIEFLEFHNKMFSTNKFNLQNKK